MLYCLIEFIVEKYFHLAVWSSSFFSLIRSVIFFSPRLDPWYKNTRGVGLMPAVVMPVGLHPLWCLWFPVSFSTVTSKTTIYFFGGSRSKMLALLCSLSQGHKHWSSLELLFIDWRALELLLVYSSGGRFRDTISQLVFPLLHVQNGCRVSPLPNFHSLFFCFFQY